MKANPFIEYYAQVQNSPIFPLAKKRKINAYYKLVSKPFEPEMLLSVFEGWEDISDGKLIEFTNWSKSYVIRFIHGITEIMFYEADGYKKVLTPKTLENLISDFARMGLELQFKEDVATILQ